METYKIIILSVISLLLLFCIYKITDTSKKLKRLKKRYDLLLRGRGEISLEDLVKEHSADIEFSVNKSKELERLYHDILSEYRIEFEEIKKNLIDTRKSLERNISDVNYSLDDKFMDLIENINKDRRFTYKQIEEKQVGDYTILEKHINNSVKELREEAINNIEDLAKQFKYELKATNDNVAMAIQNVAIHKYNAFDNQTGDLSFSMVLLDRFYNGVIITSLIGRESSYTYSKIIKSGKCDVELSPEEMEVLSTVLKK